MFLNFKLTSYADDSTFFIEKVDSINEIFKTFDVFSKYSGLKINKSKCEIAGIGIKRGVKVAFCGVKSIDLLNEPIKILGINYSYNEKVLIDSNFKDVIMKIEKVISMWRWRNLTLAGKITIFKTLAFSKIIFLSFLTNIPIQIIQKLENIQK